MYKKGKRSFPSKTNKTPGKATAKSYPRKTGKVPGSATHKRYRTNTGTVMDGYFTSEVGANNRNYINKMSEGY